MKNLKRKFLILSSSVILTGLCAAPNPAPGGGGQGGQPQPGGEPRTTMPAPPPKPAPDDPSKNMRYYRGNRTIQPQIPFEVQMVKTSRIDEYYVSLEITFNQAINPRTVKPSSITIDGEELSEKTKFSFNKKGDTMKLTVPSETDSFLLQIQDVRSYEGTLLDPVEIMAQ